MPNSIKQAGICCLLVFGLTEQAKSQDYRTAYTCLDRDYASELKLFKGFESFEQEPRKYVCLNYVIVSRQNEIDHRRPL